MYKILVIDDSEVIREMAAEFLRDSGFSVKTAENGMSGISIALEYFPDLILCDISMPGMTGYEVYSTLKEYKELSIVPFIFISSRDAQEEIRFGMKLGADDYITKPFNYEELLNAIEARLKKHNNLIKVNRENYYRIIENAPFGIFLYEDESFSFVNSKLSQLLGYSCEELYKMKLEDLFSIKENEEILVILRSLLNGKTDSINIEFKITADNEKAKYFEMFAQTNRYRGKVGLIVNLLDITDRKIKENEIITLNQTLEKRIEDAIITLEQKDKMLLKEHRQSAITEVLFNLSHYWRNPIHKIGLMLQGIEGDFKDGLVDEAYLKDLVKNSMEIFRNLSESIDNFSYVFKPDTEKKEYNLKSKLSRTLSMLSETLADNNIKTIIDIDENIKIYGFLKDFSQAIINIITNAIERNEIANVKKPEIVFEAKEDCKKIVLTISDNLGGAPEKILKKLFEPYVTSNPNKSGLGLYFVKTFIEDGNNGQVFAENSDIGFKITMQFFKKK